ncbi:hypothetical protein AB0883_14840 [Micromonospora sp. NPDC047812]|uniref:hypothetical protein n=1 Tax=Micromonospora sp. NPDC047812 TaxID=3155742 RepID=UPI003454E192
MSIFQPELLISAAVLALVGIASNVVAGMINQKLPPVAIRVLVASVIGFLVVSVVVAAVQDDGHPRPASPGSAPSGVTPPVETPSGGAASPSADRPASRSPESAALTFPASFEGSWEGTLEQTGGSGSWDMWVTIAAGSRAATVYYPGLCTGTWSVARIIGESLEIRERITTKVKFCDSPTTVILRLRSNGDLYLDYVPDVGTYVASAVLTASA